MRRRLYLGQLVERLSCKRGELSQAGNPGISIYVRWAPGLLGAQRAECGLEPG